MKEKLKEKRKKKKKEKFFSGKILMMIKEPKLFRKIRFLHSEILGLGFDESGGGWPKYFGARVGGLGVGGWLVDSLRRDW